MCYKFDLEPLTHFLTGAVLARAGFNRKTALATATMTLAAEAPDLDVVSLVKGPVYGFAHHRGFTHSFLGLILTSALVVGFVYLIWRVRGRKNNIPGLPPRWGLLFLCAYVAGLSHILLDFTNNYGVRPFWPFWEKWYSWDIVSIIEPALYIFLLSGLVLPELFSRGEPLPHGRSAALLALIGIGSLYAIRDHEHRHAVHELKTMHFNFSAPARVSAFPYMWSVSRWYAVAETNEFFASSDIDVRSGKLDMTELRFFYKKPETPATLVAKRSYAGRVYLDWAQYPWITESISGEDAVVRFKDLRYDYARMRGGSALSCTIEIDRNLNVVGEKFGARKQNPPID